MKTKYKVLIGSGVFLTLAAIFAYWYLYKKGALDLDLNLKKGMVGNEVKELQRRLNKYDKAKLSENGYFDLRTEASLFAYMKTKETTLRKFTIFRVKKTEHVAAVSVIEDRTVDTSGGGGGGHTPLDPR